MRKILCMVGMHKWSHLWNKGLNDLVIHRSEFYTLHTHDMRMICSCCGMSKSTDRRDLPEVMTH